MIDSSRAADSSARYPEQTATAVKAIADHNAQNLFRNISHSPLCENSRDAWHGRCESVFSPIRRIAANCGTGASESSSRIIVIDGSFGGQKFIPRECQRAVGSRLNCGKGGIAGNGGDGGEKKVSGRGRTRNDAELPGFSEGSLASAAKALPLAVDLDLDLLLEVWPTLSEERRNCIMAIAGQ